MSVQVHQLYLAHASDELAHLIRALEALSSKLCHVDPSYVLEAGRRL
jgi:hypothetical protein